MTEAGSHERTAEFALARIEKRVLQRLAAAMPAGIMPDHLTVIGIAGSTLVLVGYILATETAAALWLASLGLAINWFGDSLDGTLARYRRIERPRYGFYLDHLTDAYSTIAIGVGLGFSPYMLLAVGLTIVVTYLVLSINVYLETHAFGEFVFSYGAFGPTEVRLALVVINTVAFFYGPLSFSWRNLTLSAFDVVGLAIVLGMLVMLSGRVARNLRRLAALEPAGRVRPEKPLPPPVSQDEDT